MKVGNRYDNSVFDSSSGNNGKGRGQLVPSAAVLMIAQIRDQRQRDLEAHVKAVDDMLKKAREGDSSAEEEDEDGKDGAEADGEGNPEVQHEVVEDARHEDEYIDEDKYTTVTVEPMEGSENDESDSAASEDEDRADSRKVKKATTRDVVLPDGTVKKKRIWTKEKPSTSKVKKKEKPKKFRYESKVERRATKAKQSARNSSAAKARRSGGRS